MLQLLLIRHGETDWNREGKVMGPAPIPLNENGTTQARHLSKFLEPVKIDAIYSSPHRRAVETARHLADAQALTIEESPALREIEYGLWVGKSFSEIRKDPAFRIYHDTPDQLDIPGGEKMTDVFERTSSFLHTIRSENPEGRIALVSHADVIKVLLCHALNIDLKHMLGLGVDNGSLAVLNFSKRRTRLMTLNWIPALETTLLRPDPFDVMKLK